MVRIVVQNVIILSILIAFYQRKLFPKPTLFLLDNEWQGSNPLPGVIGKLVKDKNLERKDIEQKIKSVFYIILT